MQEHLNTSCELLPVLCTFAEIGCHCGESCLHDGIVWGSVFLYYYCSFLHLDLVVRTLPKHLADSMQDHLNLSLQRIMEQQAVIINLNKRVMALESSIDSQTHRIEVHEAATAASIATMVASEKTHRSTYMDNFHGLEKKFSGHVSDINNNVSRIANQVNGLEQRVAVLAKAVPVPPPAAG
jgi:hypothetical protein